LFKKKIIYVKEFVLIRLKSDYKLINLKINVECIKISRATGNLIKTIS